MEYVDRVLYCIRTTTNIKWNHVHIYVICVLYFTTTFLHYVVFHSHIIHTTIMHSLLLSALILLSSATGVVTQSTGTGTYTLYNTIPWPGNATASVDQGQ